jgi:glycosyltransferase involved in cell wall biosynthesis
MDYLPNVDAACWFARRVWPRVLTGHPNARFEIVGRNPTREVEALADIPGVDVIGEVEDVISFVSQFRVSVAPLRIARGLQNKVLEAMAAARPVVLTPAAATGIAASPGRHFLIADGASRFAHAVTSLLADPVRCQMVGQQARAYVAEHHCWQREMEHFESVVLSGTSALHVSDPGPHA